MLTSIEQQRLQYLFERTVVFRPEVSALIKEMIEPMYRQKVLMVVCLGWKRVGHDENLARALRAMEDPHLTAGPSHAGATGKRDSDEHDSGRREKKPRTA